MRRLVWDKLNRELGIQLPALKLNPIPAGLVAAGLTVSLTTIVLGWTLLFYYPTATTFGIWLGAALGGAVLAWIVGQTAHPFAAAVPADCRTLAGLTRAAVMRDRSAQTLDAGDVWSPTGVFEELRVIIVEQLGVKPEQVRPEASFFEDLGVLG